MKKTLVLSLVITMISVMFFSIPTATAVSPNLAGLDNFAILANTYTNNGGTIINGDFGYTVPPATFPTVNGATFPSPNPTYVSAQVARANLFAAANNPGLTGSCTTVIGTAITLDDLVVSGNPAGTLPPGIYCITGITTISNAITLSGDGVYIFRINGALNADPFSQIILSGAQADKIFWIPAATTLGDDSIFAGIILTDASITLGSTVSMDGRILSNGAVTTGSLSVITAPLVTITPPIVTITPPIPVPDDICNDCVPPTLGLNSDSVRRVDQGFSYNGKSSNVELILTPVKLLTTKIGDVNKAVFKIYEASGLNDPGGPDEVMHFELIFGLAKGQILGDGKAMIELDRSWDGVNTVKVIDPENSLKDVKVETSKGACKTAAVFTNDCLIVTIYHTFVKQLDFNIIATSVWDEHRNAWQNYFTPGVKVIGASVGGDSFSDILPVIPLGMKVLISDLNVTKSEVMIGETVRVSFRITNDTGKIIPWITPDVGICKVSAVKPHYVLVVPKSPLANDSDCPFFVSDFLSSSDRYNINLVIPEGIAVGKYKLDVWADPDYIGQFGVIGDHKSIDISVVSGKPVPTVPSDKIIKSPLKQIKSGIAIDKIQCKEGLHLVVKTSNENPVCVKPATKAKLIERGWAKSQA